MSARPLLIAAVAALLSATAFACSSDGGDATPASADSGAPADGGPSGTDATPPADSGPATLPTTCDGACKATALTATFGAKTGKITRAYLGYTNGPGGPVALYVDMDTEVDKGCPADTSSAGGKKKFTFDLPLPLTGPVTKATADSSVGFFDTDASDPWLLTKPVEGASAYTITPTAAKLTADGFVALDVDATFPSGKLVGHVYAAHCPVFDGT